MSQQKTLVLASGNPGKIKELQELLADQGISIIPQGELNILAIQNVANKMMTMITLNKS